MTDNRFDPYDDTIPVSERLGTQRLFEPVPEADQPPPQPVKTHGGTVVALINRRRKQSKPVRTVPQSTVQVPRSRSQPKRRELASTCLEISGLAAFSAGFWLIHAWLGLIIMGICLVVLGVATSNQLGGPRD